ncbi:hypothetical protein H4Q26_007213 [Puccinia striiformis f. sp. tritici PST-130]|nr:hypothetical protein H4Q26_007213 [Puccinia striiformis f. sp. tritici PST-130]
MQSFNFFIVFAVLLINTQFISVKSFKCPGLHGSQAKHMVIAPDQSPMKNERQKRLARSSPCGEEIKTVDGKFSCDKVDLNGSVATDSFCCDVAGRIGEVEKSKQAMWTNNCSKAS